MPLRHLRRHKNNLCGKGREGEREKEKNARNFKNKASCGVYVYTRHTHCTLSSVDSGRYNGPAAPGKENGPNKPRGLRPLLVINQSSSIRRLVVVCIQNKSKSMQK